MADGDDALAGPRLGGDAIAFGGRHGDGFLEGDVLSRVERGHGRIRMKMVGEHDVSLLKRSRWVPISLSVAPFRLQGRWSNAFGDPG